MSAEVRLANTPITNFDSSLSSHVLYTRLVAILAKNKKIDEIGILPFLPDATPELDCKDNGQTRDHNDLLPDYPFVVQERGTKLGIPIFAWVPLMEVSYEVLKEAVGNTVDQCPHWWIDQDRRQQVIESTSCLMILCPDSYIAVNARKRLIEQGFLEASSELEFLDMILTFPRNCKSAGAWHHRKWLLQFQSKDNMNGKRIILDPTVVEQQIEACHAAAQRYPKCYYAWSTRSWLVEQLGHPWWEASVGQQAPGAQEQHMLPLEREFERMKLMTERNVSDHSVQQHLQRCMIQLSGRWVAAMDLQEQTSESVNAKTYQRGSQWTRHELALRRRKRREMWQASRQGSQQEEKLQDKHHSQMRAVCFKSAIKETLTGHPGPYPRASFPWVVDLWVKEFERIHELVATYPKHESLWYHLRFMYYGLWWLDSETQESDKDTLSEGSRGVEEQDMDYVSPQSEAVFVRRIVESSERKVSEESGHQSDDEEQIRYGEMYLRWVERLDLI